MTWEETGMYGGGDFMGPMGLAEWQWDDNPITGRIPTKQELEDMGNVEITICELPLNGFTKHGLNQAISRDGVGVSSKAMLDALKNPEKVVKLAKDAVKYVGKNAQGHLMEGIFREEIQMVTLLVLGRMALTIQTNMMIQEL